MSPKTKEDKKGLEKLLDEKGFHTINKELREKLRLVPKKELENRCFTIDDKIVKYGTPTAGFLGDLILYGVAPTGMIYEDRYVPKTIDQSGIPPPMEVNTTHEGTLIPKNYLWIPEAIHTILGSFNIVNSKTKYERAKKFGTKKEKIWAGLCYYGNIAKFAIAKALVWGTKLLNPEKYVYTTIEDSPYWTMTDEVHTYSTQMIISTVACLVEGLQLYINNKLKEKKQQENVRDLLTIEADVEKEFDNVISELDNVKYDKSKEKFIGELFATRTPQFYTKEAKKDLKWIIDGNEEKINYLIKKYNKDLKNQIKADSLEEKREELSKYTFNLITTDCLEPEEHLISPEKIKGIFNDKPYIRILRAINEYINQ